MMVHAKLPRVLSNFLSTLTSFLTKSKSELSLDSKAKGNTLYVNKTVYWPRDKSCPIKMLKTITKLKWFHIWNTVNSLWDRLLWHRHRMSVLGICLVANSRCPFYRDVRLIEVSVKRESTVLSVITKWLSVDISFTLSSSKYIHHETQFALLCTT